MPDPDRVRVRTNGHRPALEADDEAEPMGGATAPAMPDAGAAGSDLRIAFTPSQLAAGFGILAGLVLLVLGSRRRGTGRDRDG